MSFLRKLMKTNNNNKQENNEDFSNYNTISDRNENHSKKVDSVIRRKFEKKLVLSQSDPEPILDLCECNLDSIEPQIQSTIKIYGKTDCRFDDNLLTSFAVQSVQSLCGIYAIHLSNNRIHTIGANISQLTHLKELYLSHNQLSALPDSISELPALKIISIRDNRFRVFPECLTLCQSLSCIDLADNHMTQIPETILRLKNILKSLQLDGNPLTVPPAHVCEQGLDAIIAYLCRNSTELNDNYGNSDIDLHNTGATHGDGGASDEKQSSIEDQKRRQLIEWERNHSFNESSDDMFKDPDKKRELLDRLWTQQRQMSADINVRLERKDRERECRLEVICDLERHSKQLLNNLYNWEERHRQQIETLEKEENQILELMLSYDHRVDLKKSAILIAMQEMLNKESKHLALTDELKDFNHLELRTKINQKEQLQRQAFEALQRTRDYKNRAIGSQILLIEKELMDLTRAEMQRKDSKLDSILTDIHQQRSELAKLLASLLEQKRERERELRQQLLAMERTRSQVNDSDFWLVQYQYLMERQPIAAQIRQFGIEDQRIANVLIESHKEFDRIANYLSLFTDISFDKLNAMSDKALLALGIDDYELCKHIRDVLDQQCSDSASNTGAHYSQRIPSAPLEREPFSPSASLAAASAPIGSDAPEELLLSFELSAQLSDVRLWRQTECVICFEQICDVVFLPCGHVCTCQTCSHLIQLCPLCRVSIDVKQYLNTN